MTDLAGNILWTYADPGTATNSIQGVKLLPNGDFLMGIGPSSTSPFYRWSSDRGYQLRFGK